MASGTHSVSLRGAAKALGIPPTSLTRWLENEPTLARSVLEQPGPRQAMKIDLDCLQIAWTALQGGTTPTEQLSERERLRRERQQRLYWQGQELQQQVLALEQQHVLASEVEEARQAIRQRIRIAVEEWIAVINPKLADQDLESRYLILNHAMHELLTALAALPRPNSQRVVEEEDMTDPEQSETQCRIQIEHYRARLHQLRAQIHRREIVSATDVLTKAWAEARLLRDQLLAIPARCAAIADQEEALRQEVMACLLHLL